MRTQDENLKALSRAALEEARTEAKQIRADARARADHIRQQAQADSETERERILQQARKESERTRSEAIASAELEARMLKLARRERLLARVFGAVRDKLETVTQWTDYNQIVRALVLEATRQVGSEEVRIRADERTRAALTDEVLDDLSKEASVELRLGDTLEGKTGIIAETADGHRRYDNTLEARLTRAQDALRTPVYHMLVGESS
jgi:V/A-type H+-transporting ATPase subunit E